MSETIEEATQDQLFRSARTVRSFLDRPVDDETLTAAWDLAKWGPTAMNAGPLRLIVVRSEEGKNRLLPHVAAGNRDRVRAAPVTLVAAADHAFHNHLPHLAPSMSGQRETLEAKPEARARMARDNAWLQFGYLIVAVRAVGLSVAPMNGMDPTGIDTEFLAGTDQHAFALLNIGYTEGDGGAYPRAPRLGLNEISIRV